MQDVEVARMVSLPTSLSTSPHTFLFSSSTSGTHSWMYLAPVTHSARLAVPLEEVLKKWLETKQTEILVNCQINRFIKPDKLSLLCSR